MRKIYFPHGNREIRFFGFGRNAEKVGCTTEKSQVCQNKTSLIRQVHPNVPEF